MPQAPLPPLQARLQPANLITPIVRGTPTPMDVIQHQQLIDYMARAKEGVETMQQVMRSKQVASESAARASAADMAKSRFASYNKFSKWVDQQKWDEGTKAAALGMYGSIYGLEWSGASGGSVSTPPAITTVGQEALRRMMQEGMSPADAWKMITNTYQGLKFGPDTTEPQKPGAPQKKTVEPKPEQKPAEQKPTDPGLDALQKVGLLDQNQDNTLLGSDTSKLAMATKVPSIPVSNVASTSTGDQEAGDNTDLAVGAPLGAGNQRIPRANFLARARQIRPALPMAQFG